MAIEVELRSFITKDKYDELIGFFGKSGELINEDYQESHYFDENGTFRIQKNNFFGKLWLKKGKLHDEQREELEVKIDKKDFDTLEKLLTAAGHKVHIKWFRNRHTFEWQGISAMVDYTKGYGYILELEKMSDEQNKDKDLAMLKERFAQLNIPITPREEFDRKYKEYVANWQILTR